MARDRTKESTDEAVDDKPKCARCGDTTLLLSFHEDTPVREDRGARFCASCWVGALERRMAGETLASKCTVPGCDLEVRDHVAHCKRIATSATWEARFASRRAPLVGLSPAEASIDRVAEAERQIRALKEWSEREGAPWTPPSPPA